MKKPFLQPDLFSLANPPVKAPVESSSGDRKEEWPKAQQCMACGEWLPEERSDLYHAAEECDYSEEPEERARIFPAETLYPYPIGPVKAACLPQTETREPYHCRGCGAPVGESWGWDHDCPNQRERSPNSDPTSLTSAHPYKGKGVKDGASMAPGRWKGK